jgi:hypothetical protein
VSTKTPEQRRRFKLTAYMRANGNPTRVPIGPARAHLRMLHFQYGMSTVRLAELCTLSAGSISELIRGERGSVKNQSYPMKEMYRDNFESVMAIRPEVPADKGGARVNAIGSARRVQGLAAIGFPVKWTGSQLGFVGPTFNLLALGKRQFVYYSTAYKIRGLYEKLELATDATQFGVRQQSARLAATYAARKGFVKPIFWDFDMIDDPDGFPDYTGQCGSQFGAQAHRRKGIFPVCQPCRDAYNEYNGTNKARARAEGSAA